MEFTDADLLLFDLDGTISDNSLGIVRATQVGLSAVGVAGIADTDIRDRIGPPLRAMYRGLGVPTKAVESAVDAYRGYYARVGVLENVVYEGMAEILDMLFRAGRPMAVATSKPEIFARQILIHFGFDHMFSFIGGASLDSLRDTKSDVVSHTLAATGTDASVAVMIGDRHHDIEGARAVGVRRSIGVTWGFGTLDELENCDATRIVNSPAELGLLLL